MTWRELDALAEVQNAKIRRGDARAARICYTMACMWSERKPSFDDFMPSTAASTAQQPQPLMKTPEAMASKIDAVMKAFGGQKPEVSLG